MTKPKKATKRTPEKLYEVIQISKEYYKGEWQQVAYVKINGKIKIMTRSELR